MGYARSGTSWLGKIFDSHPEVLYLHEPDKVLHGKELPYFCQASEIPSSTKRAAEYFDGLLSVRDLNAVSILPLFRKSYRSYPEHLRYLASIATRKATQLVFGNRISLANRPVRDPACLRDGGSCRFVVKSVSQLGRAGLLATAVPSLKTVLIVRHPCAQILSMLRGIKSDKFQRGLLEPSIVDTINARRRGLTMEKFLELPSVEQLAWQWLVFNEKAMEDLADRGDTRILRYRDLVRAPEAITKELFAFSGLPWARQTARFLYESQHSGHRYRYFGVYRSAEFAQNLDAWKNALPTEDEGRIRAIVADSTPGRLFF